MPPRSRTLPGFGGIDLLWTRRAARLLIAGSAAAAIIMVLSWYDRRLGRADLVSGMILLGMVVGLAGLRVKKCLPSLPIGATSHWVQCHVYLALAAIAVFVWHARFRWPTGYLDAAVWLLFVATAGSGLLGLYLSRVLPRRLAALNEEIVLERIPILHRQLKQQAQEVVLAAVTDDGSRILPDFFVHRLHDYLDRRPSLAYRVVPTSRVRRRLLAELDNQRRYLSSREQQTCERLFGIIRRKDDLDYHLALQCLLRAWLSVHLALTYWLLLAACLHGVVAWSFRGSQL